MAKSFISKDSIHGFWINDSLMQVVCWGLEKTIGEYYSSDEQWLVDFQSHIFNNSQGIFVGFMHLNLNEYLSNQERKNTFNRICDLTKSFFDQKGDYISTNDLNSFQQIDEAKHEWHTSLETSKVNKVIDCLIKVSNDVLPLEDENIDCSFL